MSEIEIITDDIDDETAYKAIKAAVMETARGRWFLAEFGHRNRNADTQTVMEAIGHLESTVSRLGNNATNEHIHIDLLDMSAVIAKTRAEIASMHRDGDGVETFQETTLELRSIVETTEKATGEILSAAEKVQELVWTLREAGAADDQCDLIDAQIMEIYTGCSFQDLTGQRISKIVSTVEYLENRINAMMRLWDSDDFAVDAPTIKNDDRPDAELLNGPAREGEGNDQNDVDSLFEAAIDEDGEAVPQDFADRLFEGDGETHEGAVAIADEPMPLAEAEEQTAAEEPEPVAASLTETDVASGELHDIDAIVVAESEDEPAPAPDAESILAELEAARAAVLENREDEEHFVDAEVAAADTENDLDPEGILDDAWERTEDNVRVGQSQREPLEDADLSALTNEQKQVLFS